MEKFLAKIKNIKLNQKLKIFLIGFLVGYIIGSYFLYIGRAISPISKKDLTKVGWYSYNKEAEKEIKWRNLSIFHALNPFEPMSPGWYFILKANK